MKRLIIILFALAAKAVFATTPHELFEEANNAYQRSEYAYSIELYEQILDKGLVSAELFYNLGNAYFKNNNLGPAILNYERALRLRPMDEDIIHNLEIARSRIVDRIEQRPLLFYERWWKATYNLQGVDGWAVTTIVLVILLLVSIVSYLFSRTMALKKTAFFSMLFLLILAIHSVIFTIKQHNRLFSQREAIIMQSRVTAKSSPATQSPDLFLLHEGAKIAVRSSLGQWYEIALPNGTVGWIKAEAMEII